MSAEPTILQVGEEPPPLEVPRTEAASHDTQQSEAPTQAESGTAARRSRPKGTPGRFQVINAFADFTLRDLKRADIAVWLLLWRDTKKNGTARTSQADLARRAGTSERMVRYAIGRLQRDGLLTVVRRGRLSQGPSVYRVHPLKPP